MNRIAMVVRNMWAVIMMMAMCCCETPSEEQQESHKLEVNTTLISLESAAGSCSFDITSDTDWVVDCSVEWINIIPMSGSGSSAVLCRHEANPSSEKRTATITITANDLPTHTILVSQKGAGSSSGNGNEGGNEGGNTGGNTGGNEGGNTGGNEGGNTGGNTGGGGQQTNAKTRYSGWAELPEEEDNSDYYYAYHMIPDKGNGKVRNFAVCYSEELGCPVWVASPMHSYYTAKNTSRSDAYAPDPEIPNSIQVHKRSGYTRGHLLGSSDRLVSRGANEQAFYYSNIAPQLQSGFNTGGGVWNNLESYCDNQLCADTLYMVNGCYWANHNKQSSGTVIPTHYYKVLLRTKSGKTGKWVVNCSADELKCVVFMVEHNSSQHKVQPHRDMLMSVAELEQMTGHTFFANVPNAPKESYNPSDWGL